MEIGKDRWNQRGPEDYRGSQEAGTKGLCRYALELTSVQVWIGMMVGSRLLATTAAHLLPLADYAGDLDGALLVNEQSQKFVGGFQWSFEGQRGMATFPDCVGVGVSMC